MAVLDGNLWEYNLAKVVVVDVTDDYRLMQPSLPTECYPILATVYVPLYLMKENLSSVSFLDGYLYDWHESPVGGDNSWIVGVVDCGLIQQNASISN
ncbi:MAG: hypothetical protein KDC26_11355 [Armatimonadetes bacterium]|nr:hypothetical protein [Armatimonadota bacterium]